MHQSMIVVSQNLLKSTKVGT